MDDCRGGYLATRYLLSLGHRGIVGVFKSDDTQGQQRHKGYVQALQEAGIAYDPDKVVWFYTEDRKTHPYEKMRQLARDREKLFFDGVVSYNDQIALEVIRALNDEGLLVPEDVSVTGYDNSYLASTGKVPLTTVAHPQEQLGRMAAELLLRIMKDGSREGEENQILIEPELVVRESAIRRQTKK
jgi:GntR family transcriptional regulator of arabinose operon